MSFKTREEAAARALPHGPKCFLRPTDGRKCPCHHLREATATAILREADAHDAASGVHRVSLDKASVARVALWLGVVKFPETEWADLTVHVADLLRDSARGLLTFIVKPHPNVSWRACDHHQPGIEPANPHDAGASEDVLHAARQTIV